MRVVVESLEDGVPAFLLTSAHRGGRFRIVKRVIADPRSCSVLMQIRLEDLAGAGLRLFALAAPHLVNGGAHNSGWRGDYKGRGMLFAHGDETHLAMAADQPFLASSVGFVGASDGWRQLSRDRRLTEQYDTRDRRQYRADRRAGEGPGRRLGSRPRLRPDVRRGRLPRPGLAADAVRNDPQRLRRRLALLAGRPALARAARARPQPLSRQRRHPAQPRGPDLPRRLHREPFDPLGIQQGRRRPRRLPSGLAARPLRDRRSASGLRRGFARAAHPALPAGDAGVRRILAAELLARRHAFLARPAARRMRLPDAASGHGLALGRAAASGSCRPYWPMVRKAAAFVMLKRAENQAGSVGGERRIHALHARCRRRLAARRGRNRRGPGSRGGAGVVPRHGRRLERADRRLGVCARYAARPRSRRGGLLHPHRAGIAGGDGGPDPHGQVPGAQPRGRGPASISADALVSTDALALVRFGLRAPDDPRILDTVAVIDKVLKVDLPQGPGWRRYNFDGYGEKADGRPFDGVGVGRVWPLLAGERAHYALAAGRRAEAEALLATIEAQTSSGGLIPEQVWDGPPIPSRELAPGAAVRLGDAARVGACRIRQAVAVAGGRRGVRHAAPHGAPLPARRASGALPPVARGLPLSPQFRPGALLRLDFAEPAIVLYTRDDWAHAGRRQDERHRARPVRGGDRHGRHVGGPAHRLHLARRRRPARGAAATSKSRSRAEAVAARHVSWRLRSRTHQ